MLAEKYLSSLNRMWPDKGEICKASRHKGREGRLMSSFFLSFAAFPSRRVEVAAAHQTLSKSYVSSTTKASRPILIRFLRLETRRRGTEVVPDPSVRQLASSLYFPSPFALTLSRAPHQDSLQKETYENKRNANDLISSQTKRKQRKGQLRVQVLSSKEGKVETYDDLCEKEIVERAGAEEVPVRRRHRRGEVRAERRRRIGVRGWDGWVLEGIERARVRSSWAASGKEARECFFLVERFGMRS